MIKTLHEIYKSAFDVLALIETIDLDMVLDELGYEKASQISAFGMQDYPTLELLGAVDEIRRLLKYLKQRDIETMKLKLEGE